MKIASYCHRLGFKRYVLLRELAPAPEDDPTRTEDATVTIDESVESILLSLLFMPR